jgi:hypothetical protein
MMKHMQTLPRLRNPWGALAGLLLLASGCAEYSYNRLQLGQEPKAYDRALPAEQSRRSPTGICCYAAERDRTDAIVVLLTPDRRVAGKLYAAYRENRWGFPPTPTYVLKGELDPRLIRLAEAGPVDTLRTVADELTTPGLDAFTRDAQAWIAAGMVRLLQQWPHVGDEGPAVTRLAGMLERVPAGGTTQLTVGADGRYQLEYRYPPTKR